MPSISKALSSPPFPLCQLPSIAAIAIQDAQAWLRSRKGVSDRGRAIQSRSERVYLSHQEKLELNKEPQSFY